MRRKRRRLSEESGRKVPDFWGLDSTADGRLGGAVAKDRLRKNRWGKMTYDWVELHKQRNFYLARFLCGDPAR